MLRRVRVTCAINLVIIIFFGRPVIFVLFLKIILPRKWGKETYDQMLKLALSEQASKCGVQALPAYVFQSFDEVKVTKGLF